MAPVEDLIFPRQYNGYSCRYGYTYNGRYCVRNRWSSWGRWVLTGVIIFFFLLFLFCCLISRRRRRRGTKPIYGTGWMASTPFKNNNNNNHQMYNYGNQGGYNQGGYYGQQQSGYGQAAPPPAYGQHQQPQYTGTTFNSNDGYYGQNQYAGVQPPQGTYQRDGGYSAPDGPPPGK